MLAVGVEQEDEFNLGTRQPVAQSGLDRLPFPAVLGMNDNFGATFARLGRSRVGRAVIDHDDAIELLANPLRHAADMRLPRDKPR